MRSPAQWLIPFGTFLLRFLPYDVAVAVARVLGAVAYAVLRDRRRTLLGNLAHLIPETSIAARHAIVRATFRNFATMWVDLLRLPLLTRPQVEALVRWDGREHLDEALARGHGVVLLSLHLGAYDLSAAYLAARGYAVTAVTEDIDPAMYEILRQYRSATGVQLLSRGAAVAAFRVLRRGEVLGVVADRRIAGPGIAVSFGDGRRMMPTGPVALAARAGAPLVIGYVVRDPGCGTEYRGVAEVMRMPSGSVDELTQTIATDFVRIVRQYPDQWYVFQPGWMKEAPGARDLR